MEFKFEENTMSRLVDCWNSGNEVKREAVCSYFISPSTSNAERLKIFRYCEGILSSKCFGNAIPYLVENCPEFVDDFLIGFSKEMGNNTLVLSAFLPASLLNGKFLDRCRFLDQCEKWKILMRKRFPLFDSFFSKWKNGECEEWMNVAMIEKINVPEEGDFENI